MNLQQKYFELLTSLAKKTNQASSPNPEIMEISPVKAHKGSPDDLANESTAFIEAHARTSSNTETNTETSAKKELSPAQRDAKRARKNRQRATQNGQNQSDDTVQRNFEKTGELDFPASPTKSDASGMSNNPSPTQGIFKELGIKAIQEVIESKSEEVPQPQQQAPAPVEQVEKKQSETPELPKYQNNRDMLSEALVNGETEKYYQSLRQAYAPKRVLAIEDKKPSEEVLQLQEEAPAPVEQVEQNIDVNDPKYDISYTNGNSYYNKLAKDIEEGYAATKIQALAREYLARNKINTKPSEEAKQAKSYDIADNSTTTKEENTKFANSVYFTTSDISSKKTTENNDSATDDSDVDDLVLKAKAKKDEESKENWVKTMTTTNFLRSALDLLRLFSNII